MKNMLERRESRIIHKLDNDWNDLVWVELSDRRRNQSRADELSVSFSKTYSTKPSQQCYIKIGTEIAELLGWVVRDKVSVFHHPDDIFCWRLAKTSNGHPLRIEGNSKNSFRISFCWSLMPVESRGVKKLDYDIVRDSIVFKIPVSK